MAKATNTSRICVTRAAEGAALWESGNLLCAPAPKVAIKDTVGAGDSFMAGLMVGLTRGTDTQKVLEDACRVGAFVASHDGATPLLPPEIIQEFKSSVAACRHNECFYISRQLQHGLERKRVETF